jgi:hypothetical protein
MTYAMALPDEIEAKTEKEFVRMEESARHAASIFWVGASSPIGRYSLFRKGDGLCAVRITDCNHVWLDDSNPDKGRRLNRYANYEWYFFRIDDKGFLKRDKSNVREGKGRFKIEPSNFAIWGHAMGSADTRIKCGPMRLHWGYPNDIWIEKALRPLREMDEEDRQEVLSYEFAPTLWDDVKKIDLHHPLLKWYRYDPNRKTMAIPAEMLPK